VNWTVAALHMRASYITEHADSLYVRVKTGERMETYPLSELRGVVAIREAFRLLLRDEEPARFKPPEET
jgi:hypothetical protein